MKSKLLTLVLMLICFSAYCQQCENTRWYFGADGSASNWKQNSALKGQTWNVKTFAFSVNSGVVITPLDNCQNGLKYNIEGEWRSDFVTGMTLRGGTLAISAGTEHWIGDKGFANFLIGVAVVTPIEFDDYKQVADVRPRFAVRIGRGQGYLQAVYMPRLVNETDRRPSSVNLCIGLRGFTYQNLNWK